MWYNKYIVFVLFSVEYMSKKLLKNCDILFLYTASQLFCNQDCTNILYNVNSSH